jgi:hypothetical protein
MSYQRERDQFVARMTTEGLDLESIYRLLRAATTLQRYAELACSSEAADKDRVPCPAATTQQIRLRCPCRTVITDGPTTSLASCTTCSGHGRVIHDVPRKPTGPCLCDDYPAGSHAAGHHSTIPRITVETQGDPRGYTLAVIPPSYAERNKGRDRFNLDTIGVPSGPTRLRF